MGGHYVSGGTRRYQKAEEFSLNRFVSLMRELKLYGMITMIVATAWVCAWEGQMTQAVERIRYWPAIAPAPIQTVASVDVADEVGD
jgi:hypothetical protein